MLQEVGGRVVNFENIKELIALIDQSSLKEFEFQQKDISLRLSKNENPSIANVGLVPDTQTTSQNQSGVTSTQETAIEVAEKATQQVEGKVITSPIVGVVYLQPNPESDSYVSVGDQISEGQVVCLVEAMKIMNEIKAEFKGQIVEILVENEQVVEYNQPLFRIV